MYCRLWLFVLIYFLIRFPSEPRLGFTLMNFQLQKYCNYLSYFYFSYRRMGLVVTWKCCHKGCVSVSLEVLLSSSKLKCCWIYFIIFFIIFFIIIIYIYIIIKLFDILFHLIFYTFLWSNSIHLADKPIIGCLIAESLMTIYLVKIPQRKLNYICNNSFIWYNIK